MICYILNIALTGSGGVKSVTKRFPGENISAIGFFALQFRRMVVFLHLQQILPTHNKEESKARKNKRQNIDLSLC